jgi:soluble lytic murein transglycosylase-like protein
LRQAAPTSPWLEQALLSAANLHLVHHEYDQALDAFREAQQRFPNGARASYVHWKAAWLTLRQGRNEEAKKAFEEQIALYSSGAETPAALYWRARLAEEDNQPLMARAFYQKLSDRYRNFYYAELGRQRMKHLPAAAGVATQYALLDRVPPLDSNYRVTESEPPPDDLHVQKAQLLGNGGLVDFAVRELQAAAAANGASWGPVETAQLYDEAGHYSQAIEVMKHSTPNYFALDIPDLPRKYWEALFPKAYWNDLKRSSAANGLDPYLVASLIRQESEFNPNAVSRANAVGLMQLLPKTGKAVAKEVKLKRYNASQLYTPAVNLQLGTRYFKGMVDKFGGSFEYALAAYNAGSDRVEDWLGQGKYRDPQEFVESIPFTETREYVQAILRNASVYKQIYGTPYVNSLCARDLHMRHIRPHLYRLHSRILFRLGKKGQQVLAVEPLRCVVQVRNEGSRRAGLAIVRFASSLLGYSGEIILAPADMARIKLLAGSADGENDDACVLRLFDRRIDITVVPVRTTIPIHFVNSARDHKDLPAILACGPLFNQIAKRVVRAGAPREVCQRNMQRAGCQRVVHGQTLHDPQTALLHIGDADLRGRWLGHHETANILQLRAPAGITGVVEQDKKFQAGPVALQRHPVRDLRASAALVHDHTFTADAGHLRAATRFHRHYNAHGNSGLICGCLRDCP